MKTKQQQDLLFKILRVAIGIENKGQFEVFYRYSGHVSKIDIDLHFEGTKKTNCIPTWADSIYLSQPLYNEQQTEKFINTLESILKNGVDGIPNYAQIVEAKKAEERSLYKTLKAKYENA